MATVDTKLDAQLLFPNARLKAGVWLTSMFVIDFVCNLHKTS